MPLSEFPLPTEDDRGDLPPEIRVVPPGPMSRSSASRLERVECPAFGHRRRRRMASAQSGDDEVRSIVLSAGKGANVFDVDGNRYVDLAAGFGSVLLGHGATAVLRAVDAQSDRLTQGLGDVYASDAKLALLERLAALHPGSSPKVLLGQSGSDAVTVALKTAMLATGRPGIVAFEGGYHGLGYGPLAVCGFAQGFRSPFAAQLNPRVTFAPYPRRAALVDRALTAVEVACRRGDVGAVIVEPILGRGGCVVPPPGFMSGVCDVAHRNGALVIADEIWTALGRSGSMVRTTAMADRIDILCFGKGLGGGLPISACVAPDDVMQAWVRDPDVIHTSTHAGAPLACAAAVATLDTIRFRKLAERAAAVGARAQETIRTDLASSRGVVEVRGEGLMIGIELESGTLAGKAIRALLGKGYLLLSGGVHGEVLTLTPSLTIDAALLASVGGALAEVLR